MLFCAFRTIARRSWYSLLWMLAMTLTILNQILNEVIYQDTTNLQEPIW